MRDRPLSPALRSLTRRRWPLFAAQQCAILASGALVLHGIRHFTGRTLHGGVDAIGPLDGAVVVATHGVHVGLTLLLDRVARGQSRAPLGLALSSQRILESFAGAAGALVLASFPWLLALASGHAHVSETIRAHPEAWRAPSIVLGNVVLVLGCVVEEITSRGFPMQLWANRRLWYRALVPSLAFAVLHLVDEPFDPATFAFRVFAGVTLSMLYAATGNIWLAAGVHVGINAASLVSSGAWHYGALFAIRGNEPVPNWVSALLMAATSVTIYRVLSRRRGVETR
ncbi:MAG: CPBP family intramembrane metalloprotease [Polyangiaceae bacterium]|nr:CPBP family intramembrane metalloprotease [Polyangiaceae bacterium]